MKERAQESGIVAISYVDLFARFEKFTPYVDHTFGNKETEKLVSNYEEPLFNDTKGIVSATKWLGHWKSFSPKEAKWLIILGEYGTGKTSLTRVLQYRWLQEYHKNPALPIPIRIELRNFSRQFDANGLLHHFLDTNKLSHVSIDFMNHLIRTGRVIMLLDGYDEMAQFMNSRERRACLSALAEIAKDGAKGILTSRPNYFSESEELNVFEALYRNLEQQKYHVTTDDTDFILQEQSIDELIERYVLDRYERSLQDLSPEQTESLVRRSLAKNPSGQEIVLSILNKIFRDEASGTRQSLSGKPVIIAYLLELVEELQKESAELSSGTLTEWQVYKLIIDRLMLRDVRRSTLSPAERRKALQKLAIHISSRGAIVATEQTFLDIIDEQFATELRRLALEERRNRRNELFEDLRSSATLTRSVGSKEDGWIFSHNSLREYLSVEMFLSALTARVPAHIGIPITEAMRTFVASIDEKGVNDLWQLLAELWPQRASNSTLGSYLALLWDSSARLEGKWNESLSLLGVNAQTKSIPLNDISIKDIDFSKLGKGTSVAVTASNSALADAKFDYLVMKDSTFDGAILDSVSFRDCDLSGSSFNSALLFECDFSGSIVDNANFETLDPDSSILVAGRSSDAIRLIGEAALGYLRYNGAITSKVGDIHIYKHHPKYPILEKICERISEQRNSQLRGLTQRGEARADPPFARETMDKLVALGWVVIDRNELVSVTPAGRPVIQRVASGEELPRELVEYLANSA